MSTSELSGLLEGHGAVQLSSPRAPRTWNVNTSVIVLGFVAVLVTLVVTPGRLASRLDNSSNIKDPFAFDKAFHDWESALYEHAQLIRLEGISKHSQHEKEKTGISNDRGDLVYLNNTIAFDMIKSAKPNQALDFFYYQQGWDAQINQAFCPVATTMAAMNSLRGKISLPQDPVYVPFPWATQMTLIRDDCVRENVYDIDKMENQFWGLGLEMATTLINCHLNKQGYQATAYHVDPNITSTKKIRESFIDVLEDENSRLLINYDRGGITQGPMGHGHFSPIAAYNFEEDAFLIMDVAKYKFPPVWVPTSKLMGGIGSVDHCALFKYPDHPVSSGLSFSPEFLETIGCTAQYRGYIVVSKDSSDR